MSNVRMLESALLFAQTIATGSLAAWMFTGLRDNLLYPSQNESITAEVLEMRRIQAGFPEAFTPVAHRAVTDRRRQLLAFRVVVAFEGLACLLLSIGTAALGLAILGLVAIDIARALAIIGAAIFMAIWSGMLIVGNHFSYWFGHEGAQLTHFHLNLWGLGTILLLAV